MKKRIVIVSLLLCSSLFLSECEGNKERHIVKGTIKKIERINAAAKKDSH